jgi:hypothetical protein
MLSALNMSIGSALRRPDYDFPCDLYSKTLPAIGKTEDGILRWFLLNHAAVQMIVEGRGRISISQEVGSRHFAKGKGKDQQRRTRRAALVNLPENRTYISSTNL